MYPPRGQQAVLNLFLAVLSGLATALRTAKTGKNHLNEEITPLLPTGICERFSQTISNIGHAALLRRRELSL